VRHEHEDLRGLAVVELAKADAAIGHQGHGGIIANGDCGLPNAGCSAFRRPFASSIRMIELRRTAVAVGELLAERNTGPGNAHEILSG
jgi:hypothetical protein